MDDKKLVLEKIISGGQTGADQGGLLAGKSLGLKTGGTAPPRFMTDIGPSPNLAIMYGLVEGEADPRTYVKRTRKNVKDSDGTVWFGRVGSPGGGVTKTAARVHARPFLENPTPNEILEWLIDKQIRVLNVAGNRERTNPGICLLAYTLLRAALREWRELSITHGTVDVTITLTGRRRNYEVYEDTVELTPLEWDKVIRALRTAADKDNSYAGVLVKLDL